MTTSYGLISSQDNVLAALANEASTWRQMAVARGDEVMSSGGLSATQRLRDPREIRVAVTTVRPGLPELALLNDIVSRTDVRVIVDDAFEVLELHRKGFTPTEYPVMMRHRDKPWELGTREDFAWISEPEQLKEFSRLAVNQFPVPEWDGLDPDTAFDPSLLTFSSIRIAVAYRAGRIVSGVVTNTDPSGSTGLYWMVTAEQYRGQGIGSRLLSSALSELESSRYLLLSTESGLNVYTQLGFETIGSVRRWRRAAE